MNRMEKAYIATPLGTACVTADTNGIKEVFVSDALPDSGRIPSMLEPACRQLREYFDGSRKAFTLPLNPDGTPFQKRVWKALAGIPYGSTTTYLELSRELGDVRAIRAVATANAQNPIWILIPCHRVIGSDGSMRGYAGGIWRKKWLLEHENPSGQLSFFREGPTAWSETGWKG